MDRHRALRLRPALETLEDRCCPTVNIAVIGHTMIVQGDAADNKVTITDDGSGNISATIDSVSKDGTGINYVIVNTKGGSDTVDYKLGADPLTSSLYLAVDLGAFQDGTSTNNSATFDFTAGVSAPYLAVGVLSGLGKDSVKADFGAITDSYVAVAAALGGNDDSFTATFGDLNGDADVYVGAFGGFGIDSLSVTATGKIDTDAELAVLLDGGFGNDTIDFKYEGELKGKLALAVFGSYGN